MCLAALANVPVLGSQLANLPLWPHTNPCQVLRFVGNQPLVPPFFPENWHFGREKGGISCLHFRKSEVHPRKIKEKLSFDLQINP